MIDPDALINTARLLLGEKNKGAPNQTRLRRAASTAYYALFHAILRSATDSFIGVKHRREPRYETVYRSFEHRLMKNACKSIDKQTLSDKAKKAMGSGVVSQEIRNVASAFVTLQDRRYWADYSPSGKVTRSEARDLIELAAFGAAQLAASSSGERHNFLAYLMSGMRE